MHHKIARVIIAMSQHSRAGRKLGAKRLKIQLNSIGSCRIQLNLQVLVEVVCEEESELPPEFCFIERQMRTYGIGCQSLLSGALNPDHKLQSMPIGFYYFVVIA